MQAIIIPLNKFLYHYEKHNGTFASERFFKKHPLVQKIIGKPLYIITCLVGVIILFAVYAPPYLCKWFTKGQKEADNLLDRMVTPLFNVLEKKGPFKMPDVHIDVLNRRGYNLLVYYTPEMIPEKKSRRKKFLKKLEQIKNELHIKDIFYAAQKEDVELMMVSNGVDASKSCFMSDGKIELSYFKQLESSDFI